MSLAEIMTIGIISTVTGGVLIITIIWLVKQIMSQSASTAVATEKAKQNAVAIEKLSEASNIVAAHVESDDIIARLRDRTKEF
jgi:Na+-transporting methylmalonyl-CoA/oxaloacetate decarboxylase gamma subunit